MAALPVTISKELEQRQNQRQRARRQAPHRQHQGQPAGVGMRPHTAYAAKDREHAGYCQQACAEDGYTTT